jgi:hypothetical protein
MGAEKYHDENSSFHSLAISLFNRTVSLALLKTLRKSHA